jgi:hypothetical protein
LGSLRAHTHTQSQISWHQISKTPLLSNLTNFKTNITKSMHGMRCTTSPKRARKTHYYRQDKREDESTPFLCEVWINTLLLLGLRNCHKGTDAISMITKQKGEAPSERNYFLTKCNKGNGHWVLLLFLFGKGIGCNCNEVIYLFNCFLPPPPQWVKKTHTH